MTQFNKDKTSIEDGTKSGKLIIRNSAILVGWLFLWFAPWPNWFDTNLWIKVGIAVVTFIIPGTFLYLLISRNKFTNLRFLTFGFVFSHLLMALLGIAGRVFHLPFAILKNFFMVLGILLIVLSLLPQNKSNGKHIKLKDFTVHIWTFLPLVLITGITILTIVQRVITSDDLAYIAHITNWQQMPNLNFSDVYFDTQKVESTRFWIVSTPFSQAFLADISQVSALILLGGYYGPFLVILSVLCFYDLAKTLGLSNPSAIDSVAVQVTCLVLLSDYLHPGAPFIHQLNTDKATAAFIFIPVFIVSSIQVLKNPNKRLFASFLFSGISLVLMHPIISAFAVFILNVIAILGINRDNYKKHLVIMLLSILMLSPQIGVRLVKHEAQPTIPTSLTSIEQTRGIENLISQIDNTPFYGFNTNVLEMHIPYIERLPFSTGLIAWLWLIVPLLATVTALKGVNTSYLKQYILATTLLIAIAGIPFTGWLLGYFISAWTLERTTWLYPFGISTIFLVDMFRDKTKWGQQLNHLRIKINRYFNLNIEYLLRLGIWAVSIMLIFLFMREQGLPDTSRLLSSTQRYLELESVGQHISANELHPVNVVGTDDLNDFIPALSWKAKVISYRPEDTAYPYFYSEEEKLERWTDRQTVFSREISPKERLNILQKYDVRYILLESYRFGKIRDLISSYPMDFEIFTFGRYYLIEVRVSS